jgi:hypothetical protein|tara:strand:+ start:333 stop:488 length:156 start_codon:yes stop_codon:yes gene_type:complete
MTDFKSSKFKTIMFKRKMIKFDAEGFYSTDCKDEIKVIQLASGVEELKKQK